uniref:Ribonuclease 3 n=1 Tax=Oncorhynchus kisutch TaxID=8019 RepID=A0A8C7IPR4_ONCKI
MSFHQGRGGGGCPRGRAPPGQHGSHQNYRPTNLGPPPPQPPMSPYHYDSQAQHSSSHSYGGQGNSGGGGYITAHSDYMSYPPPVPTQGGMTASPLSQCPVRPPFPNPNTQSHPNFPPPPLAGNTSGSSISGSPASAQSAYHYMMPSVPPPPFPHPPGMPPTMPPQSMSYHQPPYSMNYSHPPFPPLPNFSPGNYGSHQGPSSFKPDHGGFRHSPHGGGGQQYKAEKQQQMDDRSQRSPERGRGGRHDDHRQQKGGYAYGSRGGGGDRHKMDFPMNQRGKDRGRSPDRRRPEGGRHRSEYEQRGRTPPTRHRSRERSRYVLVPCPTYNVLIYILVIYRSGSRERKRGRWEEERDRRSDGPGMSRDRERSYTSARSRDTEPEGDEREEDELLKPAWIRCTHAENYYSSDPMDQVGDSTVVGTSKLRDLYERFEEELVKRQERAQSARPKWDPPKTKLDEDHSSSESDCESDGGGSTCSSSSDSDVFDVIAEIKRKKAHPDRLHDELWYNDPGQMNDGPLCKCSAKSRRTGIRHSIYPGEESVKECRPMNNNSGKLYHYRITVSPPTNFLTDRPTVIEYDDHEYLFEGFSLFSHMPLTNIPLCRVIRFNIDYTIHFIEEMTPENYCVKGLELFSSYLFQDILELYDWNLTGPEWDNQSPGCQKFHFMPRFVRFLPDGGKEVLSMHQVLLYLLRSSKPLVPEEEIADMLQWEELKWQKYAEECKGMIVTNPGMKPSSVRIDQLDREQFNPEVITFPIIVHFGIRPAQLSYAGDPQYQKLWKSYVKLRHLLANSPKVKQIDKQKLTQREEALQKIRQKNTMRREVTVELSSQGFWKTGIRSDLCQVGRRDALLPHKHTVYTSPSADSDFFSLSLQLAMTHPSHHLNFGMNPDHARNSLSNCGIRQPKYGDRKVHHMYMRKKGINTLINIMSRLGQDDPSPSRINHNERLEFLGDAVVEFLTSVHLYYLFPSLEEGGLATYRTAIVQNQHLAMLAKKLELDRFMLYAHGPDLCRESDLRHAMANCFEALIGAVYLEGGLEESKQLFGRLLFNGEDLREVWLNYPPHPLQVQEPQTDRQLIETSPVLQKLTDFEDTIGVMFTHCRLLARAFTLRTVGFNHLTLGHNQRMEFLGDSIMQLVATEYLFIHFPDHHEGHLTLLRSSLVNNRTQAKVAEELGMQEFAITNDKTKRPVALRTKTLADLLESFIAALYIDKDLEYVHTFMNVCFFPRLKEFILNQDWNDPKSQLQQCCLTLRTEGKEPDIPLYKTLQTVGPSHARTYTVAVYFKGERIGCGKGPSIQQAEMGAAMDALEKYNFPQMAHQKRFIERKYRQELKEMRRERDRQEKEGDEPEDSRK